MTDERGVDSLPIALASSLIILSIILGLAAHGLGAVQPLLSGTSAAVQLSSMSNDCKALLAGAPRDLSDPASPPGARKEVMLNLPADSEYVSFGIDPGSESVFEGAIYSNVHGEKKILVVDKLARFREGVELGGRVVPSESHKVIRGGGHYELTLEYAYDRAFDEKYILVY
jgi:hypothetical protein